MIRTGIAVTIALGLGLAAGVARPAEPAQDSVEELLVRAGEHNRAYDYEAALALAERAVALAPLSLEANGVLMNARRQLGISESLGPRYLELARRYPDSPIPYYLLGVSSAETERRRSYLLQALRVDDDFIEAIEALASLSRIDRDAAKTLEWAQRARDLEPGPDTDRFYATMLRLLRREVEAAAALKQLLAQYPEDRGALVSLWNLELRMRERGGDRDIGPLLANINANRHRFMGSMHDMELLANVLDGGGDEGRAMAVELWLEIAELYPEHPRAEVALARAVSLADVDAGIEILERLTSLYPDSPLRYLAHERLIERLIRAERFDEAIDYSKSLISLPDAGFVDAGAARDTLARQGKWGRSYECVGHGGWFMAGQTRVQPLGMTMILVSPGGVIRRAEGVDTVDVEAATAAASLRDSACREPRLLMLVGEALAGTPTYLELGIELLELAIESHDGSSAAPGPAGLDQMGSTMERLRAQLAALYLDVGRLDDAVALVDRMREVAAGSPSPVDRVAGRILEAAGRIDEAKVYYLRGGSGADLERVYRATADNSLETFAREDAPRLRRDARLLVPDLDVEAPLHRLLGDELTLIVLWSPQFEATRAHLESLEALGESFANSDLETLSIAAGNITYRSMTRRLASNPPPRNPARATFDLLAALGIDELPMTLLVDREGRILARQMSFGIGAEAWRAAWSAVIEGRY